MRMSSPALRTALMVLLATTFALSSSAQRRNLFRGTGAQQRPGSYGGVESEQRWNLAVNFSAERSKTVSGVYGNFWLTGIGGNLSYNFWHGLGAVADLYFMRAPNIAPHIDLSEYTYLGGLRYTLGAGSANQSPRRLQIFAQGLGGRVQAFHSVFPGATGVVPDANSYAIEAGGGIDYRIGRKIGFRVIEANYVQTALPNAQLNRQQNIRLSGGFSAHF